MGLRMARRWAIYWQGPLLLLMLMLSVVFGQIETATEVPELSQPDSIQTESLTTEASISLETSGNNDEGSLNSDDDSRNDISIDLLNSQDASSNTDEGNENNNPSNQVEDSENISESSTNPDILNNPDNDLESNIESYSNNGVEISELSSTSIFSDRLGEVNDDSFDRPTNQNDGGWQPIVPSRQPTIRFPTLAPTINTPTVTPIPTLISSSSTVPKVPISEYFAPDNFATGPLHSPEDLEASLSSSIEAGTINPNIPSSRLPELHSSVLTEPVNGAITPSLTAWDIPNVTIVETPRSTIAPTPSVAAVETEVVGNALAESAPDSTTDALPPRFNLDFEDSSPDYLLPTGDGLEYITGSEDPFDVPLSTSKPTIPSDDISSNTALPTEGIPNTGEDNSPIPVTAIASDKTEDVTAVITGSVDSIVSTTVAPTRSTIKASSRTPLWMLLSKTTPETPSESIISEVTPAPENIPSLVPSSTLISSLTLLSSEADDYLESSSLLVTDPNDSSQEILLISSSIAPSADFSTTPESILLSNVVLDDILTNSLVDETYPSLTVNPLTTVQYSELVSSSISPTVSFTPIISETNVLTSASPVTLSSSLSDSQSPDITSTTPISLEDNINESDEHNSSVENDFIPNIAIASTALSGSWENSGEPIVVTVPEVSIEPTHVGSIASSSVINSNEEVVGITPVNAGLNPELDSDISVTWTPVGTGREELSESTLSILSSLVPSSSAPSLTSSSVLIDINPEFTGGFTPIISETIENSRGNIDNSESFTSEDGPSPTHVPVLTPATATMTAPVSDIAPPRTPAFIAPTTSLPSVQSPELSSESVVPFNPNILEPNINPVTTKSVILTTTPTSFNISVTKSPSLSPTSTTPVLDIFTEEHSLPNASVSMDVSTSTSRNISSNKPMIIVTEKLPATPTVFTPDNKSSSTSTAFFSPDGSSSTAVPSVEVTVSPSISTLLTPTVSTTLLSPTVTEEQPITEATIGTTVATTEAPVTTKTTPTTTTEESEEIDVEVSTELSTTQTTPKDIPITTPKTTTTTTTTTTTSTTTQRPLDITSTTETSTDGVISVVSPTGSMPYPTTTLVLSNGSRIEKPVPYIRAEVDYSAFEFCDHEINFRSMLSQWITQHLQEEISVSPNEIEFFNMPNCSMMLKDSNNNMETNESVQPTNVFFYVTSQGKIDPSLTEKFPINPRELELPQKLHYLREMVTQLELIPVEDNYWSDDLQLEEAAIGTSIIVIIVVATLVGLTVILGLVFFMIVKRRGSDNNYYGRRCTPVSMDAYSMDSVSVYHSFRRKSKRNKSSRSVKSYLNQAFDDPNGPSRPLNFAKLTHFISDIDGVHEEFSTIPVNMPKYDEMPQGVEDKNRYANVIPVPETRVTLKAIKDSNTNAEYINANYVRGPRSESKYYIATQAPLDETVQDFWRMVWEQETRVIVMMTDFVEKGIDKCADYLPPSETLDCHRLYGDFQVTLKSRDMREKYVVSNVQLKNLENNLVREIAHMWYTGWPAAGVPNEEGAYISFILEIRRTRKKLRAKGPIVVHCSPGTGRTGTFLSCDLCMRQFEEQRSVDIPRTVYAIRRDRAGAVQTKEQYAFIYRTVNLYASKLTTGNLDSL